MGNDKSTLNSAHPAEDFETPVKTLDGKSILILIVFVTDKNKQLVRIVWLNLLENHMI